MYKNNTKLVMIKHNPQFAIQQYDSGLNSTRSIKKISKPKMS